MKKCIFRRAMALTLCLMMVTPYSAVAQTEERDDKVAEDAADNHEDLRVAADEQEDLRATADEQEDLRTVADEQEDLRTVADEQEDLRAVVDNHEDLRAAVDRANDGDTIIVRGFGDVNDIKGQEKQPWVIDKKITIRGEKLAGSAFNPSISLRAGGIILGADVTLENIELSFANRVRNIIMANGHTLTLKDVTVSDTTQYVNLACGGLTGYPSYYQINAKEGNHGQIILSGNTKVANVYAGSIAYADWNYQNGRDNQFTGSSTITIQGNKAKADAIYASGAQERPVDETGDMFSKEKTKPPIQDAAKYTVNGTVNIQIDGTATRTLDGATGGNTNANITLDTEYPVNNLNLSNVGSLTINSGSFQPIMTQADNSLADATVKVVPDARLDFQKMENKKIGSLEGGGMIVLGRSDTLHITGNVAGNTKVAIGGTNNDGTASSTVPAEGHTYVAAPQSTGGVFTLIPYATRPDMVLEKDTNGNWKIPGEAVKEIKVRTAKIPPAYQTGAGENFADIPIEVEYTDPTLFPSMSKILLKMKVNEKDVLGAKGQDGYVYMSTPNNLILEFIATQGENAQGDVIDIDGLSVIPKDGGVFTDKQYKIDITIPGKYTENGQDIPLSTTLTVTDGEVQPPQPPQPPQPGKIDLQKAKITVNESNFVYNKTEHTPEITVTVDGTQLVKDHDYTVAYTNNTNAGEATITITAVDGSNYTGSATTHFTIAPAQLKLQAATIANKIYDGTTDATITDITFYDQNDTAVTLKENTDYTAQAQFNDANVASANNVTVTVRLSEQTKQNYTLQNNTLKVTQNIEKAVVKPVGGTMAITNHREATYTYDLMQLLSNLEGGKQYGDIVFRVVDVTLQPYYTKGADIQKDTLTLPIVSVDSQKEGEVGTITIGIQAENYTIENATIAVNAVNKIVLQGEPTLSATTLTYGDALSEITLSGTMTDGNGTKVEGVFAWENPAEKPAAGSVQAQWKFTPKDEHQYQIATGHMMITVQKATPTGTPEYTKITTSGKTLADAKITTEGASFSTKGKVAWDLPEDTAVKANTAYYWTFTPDDTNNYNILQGSLTPYAVSGGGGGGSSSGGGGGGGGSTNNTSSSTTTNKDGSTITVEKKKDGTTITTTKHPDGLINQVETKKDGTTIETITTKNGTVGQIVEDADGNITAISGQVSEKDAQAAQKKGQAVTLPVKVPVAPTTAKAPSVKVDVPKGGAQVEIPADHLTSGTVAVIVHQDGTEELVKSSGLTKDGVTLKLSEDVAVKLVDHSKSFQDVQAGDWHKNAVDFMSARELMHGTSNAAFSPKQPLSRGMLAAILYNLENQPKTEYKNVFLDVSKDTWCADALNWAAQQNIIAGYKDGTVGVNDNITREQLAVMLYRYAGSPESAKQIGGFADDDNISAYAKTAVAWAVQNGIISGKGNGKLDPKGQATRAEAAQMMMHFINQSF